MRRLLVVLAIGGSLLLAVPAWAEIVPQRSIAGVHLSMSRKQVRAVLGKPAHVKKGSNDFGPYTVFRYPGLVITFQGNASATNIASTRRGERLANGIGIGSTKAAVQSKVAGVACSKQLCHLGRFRPGKRVTTFRLEKNRVVEIDVGLVID